MNKVNAKLESLSKTFDSNVFNSMGYCFMDGVPADFDYKADNHTIILVDSESRSQMLLRGINDDSIFRFGRMRQWKYATPRYRRYARNAVLKGDISHLANVSALKFNMRWLMSHAEALHRRHSDPATVAQYQARFINNKGIDTIRLLKSFDSKGRPIEMPFVKITVLLLWAEFIIWRFERLEYDALQIGAVFDGLVVMGDMLHGDSVQNGDKSASVIRSAVNDAYKDKITFRNYTVQERTIGESFADNLAGIVHGFTKREMMDMQGIRKNRMMTIITPKDDFTFRKIS